MPVGFGYVQLFYARSLLFYVLSVTTNFEPNIYFSLSLRVYNRSQFFL
jgi:hypothetical protein